MMRWMRLRRSCAGGCGVPGSARRRANAYGQTGMGSEGRQASSREAGLRASDAERERIAARLREHFVEGRLSDDEVSDRLGAVYAARTTAELDKLTADLPERGRGEELDPEFRGHLTGYLLVNLMLIGIWAASGAGYFWPIWPILGWGLAVAFHAAGARNARGQKRAVLEVQAAVPGFSEEPSSVDEVASSVAAEQPSLRPAAAPDGTVTIMFSDIEGSTVLNDRLGDVRWLELLRAHNAVIREQIETHAGFEVKSQGDGFMVAFPSARRALQCARGIQDAITSEFATNPDGPVRVRIGLHTGEALREESDFYGKNVVVAARIADHARGGQILASSVVKELTESAGDVNFEGQRAVELEGLSGTHTVYEVR
jgi:class 3 adenylate cyclase